LPVRSRKAVMLIEADPYRRRDFYNVLRLTKVDVISSKDSDQAMELVRREHPELIFLNMYDDETDGISFLKQLRCYGLGRKIIVIGMVGDDDPETHKAASLAGPDKLLERDPPPHLVLELILGYLKIEKIEVPDNMQNRVGKKNVVAAPEEALKADEKFGQDNTKPIIKSLGTLLALTEDAGKSRQG